MGLIEYSIGSAFLGMMFMILATLQEKHLPRTLLMILCLILTVIGVSGIAVVLIKILSNSSILN